MNDHGFLKQIFQIKPTVTHIQIRIRPRNAFYSNSALNSKPFYDRLGPSCLRAFTWPACSFASVRLPIQFKYFNVVLGRHCTNHRPQASGYSLTSLHKRFIQINPCCQASESWALHITAVQSFSDGDKSIILCEASDSRRWNSAGKLLCLKSHQLCILIREVHCSPARLS